MIAKALKGAGSVVRLYAVVGLSLSPHHSVIPKSIIQRHGWFPLTQRAWDVNGHVCAPSSSPSGEAMQSLGFHNLTSSESRFHPCGTDPWKIGKGIA